jgi:hypothetical protein
LAEVSEVERKRVEESLEDGKAHEFLVDTIYRRMTARETRNMVLAAWKIQPEKCRDRTLWTERCG